MKKIVAILLCMALLCSMIVITAQATDDPCIQADDATVVVGNTVTIPLNVINNPGIAAIGFTITVDKTLGAAFTITDNADDALGCTPGNNTDKATPYWSGSANETGDTIGYLNIAVPANATTGIYTVTVASRDIANTSGDLDSFGSTTFTLTVADKVITGVNVAIDAGLAIGVHVKAADITGVSITAVNVAKSEFATITNNEEGEDGDYIFYLNVSPWAMDADFKVDFTENFVIDGGNLDLDQLPATAKTTGILSYCNALLASDPSDELVQLIADLLAYGQAAQTYQLGEVTLALPVGLEPSEGEWDEGGFGDFCSDNYPEDLTGKNSTAKKKFKFVDATIDFGAKFVVTFSIGPNVEANKTAINGNAHIKVGGVDHSLEAIPTDSYTGLFTYAFSPAQYGGVTFNLYAASGTGTSAFAWINNYGPAHYAAYLNDHKDDDERPAGSDEIIDLLEAFYNYGVSVEAYIGG